MEWLWLLSYLFFKDFFVAVPVLSILFSVLVSFLFFAPKKTAVPVLCVVALITWYVHTLSTGFEHFYRYIHAHGVSGELVISDYVGSGNTFNDVEVLEATGYVKTADGRMLDVRFLSDPRPQYPMLKNFILSPKVVYKIRYLKSDPTVFVVDNGDPADVARRNLCLDLRERVPAVDAKVLLDPLNETLLKEKAELESRVQSTCRES